MKICFLTENFTEQSPAQQLLDRFLIGYPRDGAFHKPKTDQISIATQVVRLESTELLRRRELDFKLVNRTGNVQEAIKDADGIVVVSRDEGVRASESLVEQALQQAKPGSRCFVYGSLARSLDGAIRLSNLADRRKISLCAGTAVPVTWRLPQVDIEQGTPLREALIIVQGHFRIALLEGLDGILSITERREGGQGTVQRFQTLKRQKFWRAAEEGLWSKSLFAAAISRSDSPLGDPEKDGRTQDLVGLGLVPKLARSQRAWVLDYEDGFRTTVLQLNGVVGDCNFAVETKTGEIVSAQIYRPPAPARQEFSPLAEVIERFFSNGSPPWSIQRSLLIAHLMDRFTASEGF